jgi:hypothetical protein
MNDTQQLHDLGQSLWLDDITRGLLTSGTWMMRRAQRRPSSCAGSAGSRVRDATGSDSDRGLWVVYDATGLGLGAVRLGICAGMVPRE